MPNWVSNDVSVKASDGDLREFYSRHIVKVDGKQSFDFSTIVPIDMSDEDYHGTETRTMKNGEEYRVGGNWYEWNLEHWGTKWNSCNTDASDLVDNGVVSFQTAWCPPEPIMISLAKMYPTFHFEWTFLEEQGWGGVYDYTNGKENITKRRLWDVPSTHDERIEIFDYCYYCEDGDEEEMEMCEGSELAN